MPITLLDLILLGVMLISGDPERCAAIAPDLEKMTARLVNLGPKSGAAAAY